MTDDDILTHGVSRKFPKGEEAAALYEVVMEVFHPAVDPEISNRGRKDKGWGLGPFPRIFF